MTSIETKRHPVKFYLTVSLCFLFFMGMGFAVISIFFTEAWMYGYPPKYYFLLALGIGIIVLGVYSLIQYFKNAPVVEADTEGIRFGNDFFSWKEVHKIELTGKMPFKYVFNFPMEGMMIELTNGSRQFFFDDMYTNGWKLKCFIEQVVLSGKDHADITTPEKRDRIRLEQFRVYTGNQFLSMRGIVMWALIGYFMYLGITTHTPARFLSFALPMSLVWIWGNSYLMYYAELSDTYLVVKNHNWLWVNTAYRLDAIREIVFESQGKMPNCLRVITTDYRNTLYPAATLSEKTWLAFKHQLEAKGIRVRNECIFE